MTDNNAITPLPEKLARRYHDWHRGGFDKDRELYRDLVDNGQHPEAMVVSCCDSRVHSMQIMGGRSGDFFIHRNIANLIPPHDAGAEAWGTGAALEYAVTALKVQHIIIMGHAGCGGIEGGYHRCNGTAGRGLEDTDFIGAWLDLLKPAFAGLDAGRSDADRIAALEKHAVVMSLENLKGYGFIAAAVAAGRLSLHGLWHDIASGRLMTWTPASASFEAV